MTFNSWMNSIADAGRDLLGRYKGGRDEKDINALCADLCSNKGEAMGTALACAVVNAYHLMDESAQLTFFQFLVSDYSVSQSALIDCAEVYKAEPSQANLEALKKAVESPRQALFRRINMSPTGTPTLVAMRADLQNYLKEYEELRAVDSDLKQLLETWFNRGFLKIRTINWQTPAHILEKLIAYEAVHAMNGWEDLRRRLEDDRRCFAFFHPALKDEPLIFVEVALTTGLATKVQPLLAARTKTDLKHAEDTAIFYSISNCQAGLKGITFGNFLIKQVVMELREELPHLTQFSTLSPIPTFGRWLMKELENSESRLISSEERVVIEKIETPDWHLDANLSDSLKQLMMRLGAHYLHNEKRGVAPLDPVARFHLGNGACLEQLNWMGDVSTNGLAQSSGMLVNYLYKLNSVEENHEAYVNDNIVARSKSFAALLSV